MTAKKILTILAVPIGMCVMAGYYDVILGNGNIAFELKAAHR